MQLPEPNFGLWFQRVARQFGEREVLRRRTSKEPSSRTYGELQEEVRRAAAGFASLGLKPGERVGLITDNRREWLVIDLALAGQGAVDVPRGADSSNLEIVTILAHSGARGAVVDTLARAHALAAALDNVPGLEFVILLEGDSRQLTEVHHLRALTYDELVERGRQRIAHGIDDLATRAPNVRPDDLLTLVYTSGTTGAPKGVQLTHGNVLSNLVAIRERLPVSAGDVALSILPTWHMFERLIEYVVLDRGGCLVYTDARRLRADLVSQQPRLMGTVPRIWEGLHDSIEEKLAKAPARQQKVFRLAARVCMAQVRAGAKGRWLLAALLSPVAALARKVVFEPLIEKAGLRALRVCVSGGGSLPQGLDEFFLAIGIPLLNGYGLTETSPVIAVRRLERNRPGPVGAVLPETEVRIVGLEGNATKPGETGVLRVRGPQVTRGYFRDEEQTARAFPEPEWFDTGDLARVDGRGDLWIVGRAKDTIALRGGEKVEPERVEAALRTSPLIAQAVLVGQDAKNVAALLVPNLERLAQASNPKILEERGETIDDEGSRQVVRKEIDRVVSAEAGFRPYERPVRFRLLRRPMDTASGLMTATLKLKRRVIADRFAPLIAELLKD